MINLEPQITYPLFFNAGSKSAWEELNQKANELLGLASDGADNYSNPIIDKDGNHFFVVNPEVAELIEIAECVEYDKIIFPSNKI